MNKRYVLRIVLSGLAVAMGSISTGCGQSADPASSKVNVAAVASQSQTALETQRLVLQNNPNIPPDVKARISAYAPH